MAPLPWLGAHVPLFFFPPAGFSGLSCLVLTPGSLAVQCAQLNHDVRSDEMWRQNKVVVETQEFFDWLD